MAPAANGVPAKAKSMAGVPPARKPPLKTRRLSTPNVPNGLTTASLPNPPSAYEIMAHRIANRVAEFAENITFAERPKAAPQSEAPGAHDAGDAVSSAPGGKKQPRKLEIRLPQTSPDSVAFSAPFLDNTLSKMLDLQGRMLKSGNEVNKNENVDEKLKKELFAQSAELSKIIALICAEKARQSA
ncbi:hypothetical protein W97_08335 [Coniosporium apollinis CBS 100218]|uniref:Uncharacterized protein n=1 Tax=Coniosporium apollinis (strain CBS 100218) TaxID=1168221 RepID=R7Z574_CONA1|nr:uncharacterized protein W97_08335 [Coniosporium apollinis CBS 100218]EON69149.1 hypothetical protein W97_08335 [Coniosporium apollinis CBS 100218]